MKKIFGLLLIIIVFNSCDNATQTNYYPNDFKKSEGRIYEDHKTGEWNYWDETGNLIKKEFYTRDEDLDHTESFYKNGQMKTSQYFQEGKPNKEWIYWNEKGQVIKKEFYENGKLISTQE